MLNARRIAHQVLVRCDRDGAYVHRALDTALSEAGRMDERDKALATEIVYGTLRRQVFIDHALAHFSKQKLASLDPEVRTLLRMGTYQVLYLRAPVHASVHTTVELAKEYKRGRAVTYVNAVLRAVAREAANILIPPASIDPAGHLSLTESFPRDVVAPLVTDLGYERAAALLASLNHPAPLTLRVNSRKGDRHAAIQRLKSEFGIDALPTSHSPAGLTLDEARASLGLLRPKDGAWQAQDEAAQLVSYLAGPKSGQTVLDACAAPGGKTCHLAELMDDQGSITALDVHSARASEIEEAVKQEGLTCVTVRAADATLALPFAPTHGYDLVVADAPCSGLGTVRRHPEVKNRRSPEDIKRLAELQARLLANLAKYVKPGGYLIYAVCTFTSEEGPAQVEAFLKGHRDYSRAPAPAGLVDWTNLLNADGDLVLIPPIMEPMRSMLHGW